MASRKHVHSEDAPIPYTTSVAANPTRPGDTAYEDHLVAMALEILDRRLRGDKDGTVMCSLEETIHYLRLQLASRPYEIFAVLLLDNRHCLIRYVELFRGTIDGASVHPREVVREVMQANAAAVILVHNHPSGVVRPSQSDLRITQKIKESLALIDTRVLDHVIVGDGHYSMAQAGML